MRHYCIRVAGKYREFHMLYNNKQFTEAGALLLSLLTAHVAPKRLFAFLVKYTVMRRIFPCVPSLRILSVFILFQLLYNAPQLVCLC